ncbi:unnamed protein product [Oppiella nova]|uniref:NR LBD domain-containing protein n=1 Tax=Oppiella nova TaxID=334625 RepID=A0A7R9LDP0_9ACAR|nr:unnamed protein product [Oppiella nova]CAG2162606.1 unnamed protein product [Oppiella nova]
MYDFHQTIANKFDSCIRNLTTFVKGLSAFRDIYSEDQISLLKYGCFDVIFLRSIKEAQRKHMIEDTPKTLLPPLLEEVFDMTPGPFNKYVGKG